MKSQHSIKQQQQIYEQSQQDDDSMDFKPDPNFLMQLNKNMQQNDAINKGNNNNNEKAQPLEEQ